jgi:hypothetical protein
VVRPPPKQLGVAQATPVLVGGGLLIRGGRPPPMGFWHGCGHPWRRIKGGYGHLQFNSGGRPPTNLFQKNYFLFFWVFSFSLIFFLNNNNNNIM